MDERGDRWLSWLEAELGPKEEERGMKQWLKEQWARVPEENQPIVACGLGITFFLLVGGGLVVAGEMSPGYYAFDMLPLVGCVWYGLTRPKPEEE